MTDANPEAEMLIARITDVEALLTHLQRTVQELDQVILEQRRQLDGLTRTLAQMTSELSSLRSPGGEERKPDDEKPPHY